MPLDDLERAVVNASIMLLTAEDAYVGEETGHGLTMAAAGTRWERAVRALLAARAKEESRGE